MTSLPTLATLSNTVFTKNAICPQVCPLKISSLASNTSPVPLPSCQLYTSINCSNWPHPPSSSLTCLASSDCTRYLWDHWLSLSTSLVVYISTHFCLFSHMASVLMFCHLKPALISHITHPYLQWDAHNLWGWSHKSYQILQLFTQGLGCHNHY